MSKTKLPIHKQVSAYFRKLARKANAKTIPGSPEAIARTAKARAALKANREAKKAAESLAAKE